VAFYRDTGNQAAVRTYAKKRRIIHTENMKAEWPDISKPAGSGLEAYHTVNEHFEKKGGGAVIYSCLPIAERTGLPVPMIMLFEKNYPIPLKAKVIANMKRWGFE
jgi:hypothetical protein